MNKSKGIKNVFWGLLSQVITIGIGIVIPRLVLVYLGSESNGLLNSVSSILSYMSLLEAGVGTATLQALYKPFSENDHKSINEIMAATDFFYRRTGFIYLTIVILLSFVYTLFINTTISKIYVFLVVMLSGLSGVMSYFFQGKFRIFLMAEGKNYIITNITTFTSVGTSLTKAIILLFNGNVVLIQSVYFIFNLMQMLFFSFYIKKNYKWLNLNVKPNFEALSQKNAVLVHQITELIFNNTDVVILSFFTTLKTVSVYSMYAMIFGMVKSVSVTFADSFLYSLGQSYDDKQRFLKLHNTYEVFNMAITFSIFCISAILILPFLKLYTSGVNDINYLDGTVATLFVAFYLMQNGRKSSQVVINIAQHFEKTKWRAVLEAIINLSVSIIMTAKFGIYGVLWGTIAALFYRTNDVIIYAAKLMERSPLITYRRWFRNVFILLFCVWVTHYIGYYPENYLTMVIYGCVLSIMIIPTFILINAFMEKESGKYVLEMAMMTIRKR